MSSPTLILGGNTKGKNKDEDERHTEYPSSSGSSSSDTDSSDSSSEGCSDSESEDEVITQEYLNSLLQKARESAVAKSSSREGHGGQEDVIELPSEPQSRYVTSCIYSVLISSMKQSAT
jgi:hypothetical protein